MEPGDAGPDELARVDVLLDDPVFFVPPAPRWCERLPDRSNLIGRVVVEMEIPQPDVIRIKAEHVDPVR